MQSRNLSITTRMQAGREIKVTQSVTQSISISFEKFIFHVKNPINKELLNHCFPFECLMVFRGVARFLNSCRPVLIWESLSYKGVYISSAEGASFYFPLGKISYSYRFYWTTIISPTVFNIFDHGAKAQIANSRTESKWTPKYFLTTANANALREF